MKVATPLTAVAVSSPLSSPPPGLLDKAIVTLPLKVVTRLPEASATEIVSPKPVPATTLAGGCAVTSSWVAVGVTLVGPVVAEVKPLLLHLKRVAVAGRVEHQAGKDRDALVGRDRGRAVKHARAGISRQRDRHAAAPARGQVAERIFSRDDQPEAAAGGHGAGRWGRHGQPHGGPGCDAEGPRGRRGQTVAGRFERVTGAGSVERKAAECGNPLARCDGGCAAEYTSAG